MCLRTRQSGIALFLGAVTTTTVLFLAFPHTTHAILYSPGETLDPACAPADANCGVTPGIGSGTTGQIPYYAANGVTLSATSTITILSSGRVGISTTTPGSLFSIGSTNGINFSTATSTFSALGGINIAAGCFSINGTCVGSGGGGSGTVGSGTTGQIPYYAADGTTLTATSTITLLASGRVGIGTTTPSQPLSVQGNALFSGNLSLANLTATGTISAAATTTSSYFAASTLGTVGAPAFTFSSDLNTGFWSPAANILAFSTNGSERLRTDATGRTLFGYTTPISIGGSASGILQIYSTSAPEQTLARYSGSTAPHLTLARSRSSTIGSNLALFSGNDLGVLTFAGDDGTTLNSVGAEIRGMVGGNVSTGIVAGSSKLLHRRHLRHAYRSSSGHRRTTSLSPRWW